RFQEDVMVGRVLSYAHHAGDARDAILVLLKRRIPEILRIMLLAGEEAGVRRLWVGREGEREPDLHSRAVGAPCLALEVEHVEVADPGGAERLGIGRRALAFQHQHRKALALREEVARERAERQQARPCRWNALHLPDGEQLDEYAGKL